MLRRLERVPYHGHGLPSVIWWNNLERIMAAVHDLGGLELLE